MLQKRSKVELEDLAVLVINMFYGIEKTCILTCCRVDDQVTLNNLPEILLPHTYLVVQAWERDKYKSSINPRFDQVQYIVLPDNEDFHYTNDYALANTRHYLYCTLGKTKYAQLDDDLKFRRRNSKYFGNSTDEMEKSQRKMTPEDFIEMYTLFSSWLDDDVIGECQPRICSFPPGDNPVIDNKSIHQAMFFDGRKFHHLLKNFDIKIPFCEDLTMALHLLTNGIGTRKSDIFVFDDNKNESVIWKPGKAEKSVLSFRKMETLFPELVFLEMNEKGELNFEGYRGPKHKVLWSKAFNHKRSKSLI